MPVDKAKAPLRELLRERAEKMGQNLNRIPYKDTFWKGTTRTRPRESVVRGGVVKGITLGCWSWVMVKLGYLTCPHSQEMGL